MPTKSITFKRARTPHYDDPAAVGRRVYEAREAAGLSQRELAFPGCSAAYISRIERGERVPSLQVMRELARRTGVTEEQLAFGREKVDPSGGRASARGRGGRVEREQGRAGQRLQGTRASCHEGGPDGGRIAADASQAASVGSSRMTRDADIVVVGAGITGASAARALAQAGRGVLLVEQFEPGHDRGSSHGGSRIFRLSYPDQHFVRLAQGALQSLARARGGVREHADRADRGRWTSAPSLSRTPAPSQRAACATSCSRTRRCGRGGPSPPSRASRSSITRTRASRSPGAPGR